MSNPCRFKHHVSSIDLQDGRWSVKTQSGEADVFDVVVLTMPVPQVLGLTGTIKELIGGCDNRLVVVMVMVGQRWE